MKICTLETFRVPPRWLFVRVGTDDGLVGWGEPIVEGRAGTVEAAIGEFADYLIGSDPLRIEDTWQVLTRGGFYRGGAVLSSAVSGIDQALWDIAGKVHGVPVHVLLGGPVRDTVRVYGWIYDDHPERAAEEATRLTGTGITAVKVSGSQALELIDTPATLDRIVARIGAVRDAIGPERDLAIDFHGRFTIAMARRALPLLEEFSPMFVEEPVAPELTWRLRDIVESTSIPIATGERLYSRWDFRQALDAGIVVAQPDPSHAGGISEVRRIAAQAETYGASLAPHCPLGPIALAASLQIDFAVPNFLIQEQSLGIQYHQEATLLEYLVEPATFDFRSGTVARPLGPGLGIEVDEAAVRAAARRPHRWRPPIWRGSDGAFTDW